MEQDIKTIREEQPLMVTIRCITYNHEPYIRQCLEGFVMQKTNFRFEAIVHDDASTDGTADIIREYAEKYPDIIKPIYETENQYSKHDGSLDRIMNDHTHGKYVAICEGDDYWIDPLKLQKQVDFLEGHPEYGMCYTNVDFYYQNTDKRIHNALVNLPVSFEEHLINTCYLAPPTWLIKKNDYPSVKPSVDGTFAIALELFVNSKIFFLNEVTAIYRIHGGGVTQVKDAISMYRRVCGVWRLQRNYKRKYASLVSDYVKRCINNRIFKICFFASTIGDKNMMKVAKKYAKVTRQYNKLLILLILKSRLINYFLKKYYSKKGVLF